MKIAFTKMQGAGNDFIVIDATREPLELSAAQWRLLADRRFGIGADQILLVQASDRDDVDFIYRIFNADGQEVEQCGNGARCFARFVSDKGLTTKTSIRVATRSGVIAPTVHADGTVTVDMGPPQLTCDAVGFDASGLAHRREHGADLWELTPPQSASCWISVVSMGNPHAVQWVDHLEDHPVAEVGAWLESHPRFRHRVNAGFVAQQSSQSIALRVFERGSGETLACGTGACAAVVAGIRLGKLDPEVQVHTHGGVLTIAWEGASSPTAAGAPSVLMRGPATTVFHGEIDIPT